MVLKCDKCEGTVINGKLVSGYIYCDSCIELLIRLDLIKGIK